MGGGTPVGRERGDAWSTCMMSRPRSTMSLRILKKEWRRDVSISGVCTGGGQKGAEDSGNSGGAD